MDFIATVLGLQLPTLKARGCLQPKNRCGLLLDNNDKRIIWGCDRDLWDVSKQGKEFESDDETASTLSDSENSFSSSSDSFTSSVTFATPVVTDVFIRPFTDRTEKADLYYTENDYRQFRMDYRISLIRRKSRMVTFATPTVSHVHTLPAVENKHDIYYSPSELKE